MATSITGQGIAAYKAPDDALSSESKNAVQNKVIDGELSDVKNAIGQLQPAATSSDIGKALIVKTVDAQTGKPSSYEYGEAGGGMTATASNLLLTILEEGIYGTDQSANIELLRKALQDIKPVSISAVIDSVPLVGLHYSDLKFVVTATFDDESTLVVDGYRVVTPGAIVSGSNTVTVVYRGVSTDVTFTASSAQTYMISYNLTDVTASNRDYLIVAGERYETTLSVEDGYFIDSVVVTMGGVDITSTAYINKTITIAEVTGDVTITAIAAEYTFMDPLIRTKEGYSSVYGYTGSSYTDSAARIISVNYYGTAFVSEYPAQNTCSLHWIITNNTDSSVSLAGVGFGAIPCNDPNYPPVGMSGQIHIPYTIKCTTQSGYLDAGQSIEGDYTLQSGYQLAFIAQSSDGTGSADKLTISIRGSYVADTFSGYDQLISDYTAQNYGNYRTVKCYSDNGETEILSANGYPQKITDTLAAGTYDFYYRFCCDWDKLPAGGTSSNFCIGALENSRSVTSNYASLTPPHEKAPQIWNKGQFRVTDNGMTVCKWGGIGVSQSAGGYVDIRVKEVTE